jgi:hypothetical protein
MGRVLASFVLSLLGAIAARATPVDPSSPEAAASTAVGVSVEGTELRVTAPDGRVLSGEALVGAVLTVRDPSGERRAVRIDAVERDPRDPEHEVVLYALSVRDAEGAPWRELCRPGPDGHSRGFALANEGGRGFRLTCTSGAVGKCVRWGYKPWRRAADGTSLAPVHAACVRMARADYCGDGTPHTRDGTLVDVYDPFRVRVPTRDAAPTMTFEAAWGPDGAVCVRRVRIPEKASLDGLLRECPAKLAGRVGEACTEEGARRAGALVMNRSGAASAAPGGGAPERLVEDAAGAER